MDLQNIIPKDGPAIKEVQKYIKKYTFAHFIFSTLYFLKHFLYTSENIMWITDFIHIFLCEITILIYIYICCTYTFSEIVTQILIILH